MEHIRSFLRAQREGQKYVHDSRRKLPHAPRHDRARRYTAIMLVKLQTAAVVHLAFRNHFVINRGLGVAVRVPLSVEQSSHRVAIKYLFKPPNKRELSCLLQQLCL